MARVNVYVDGLNLYYGVARNTPYRWLNLRRLSEGLIRPGNEIHRIRYFTARVTDHEASVRQAAYLRALATIPNLTIHEGHFRTYPTSMPRTDGGGMAEVYRTEEKGSDVNLASHLLFDACDRDFETALVISNDTDLMFPVREVRHRLGVTVGISCPVYHRDRVPSRELVDAADFRAHITRRHRRLLRQSQFTDPIIDAEGREIRKPPGW
ncbi:MAG: NYN domain-containing protein [Chloroflexi bacterium]|nr:NYN domain-containing protein [Chloroflexota bacterium]